MVVEKQLYEVLESFLDKGNKSKTVDFDTIFSQLLCRSDHQDFDRGEQDKLWQYDKSTNILKYNGRCITQEGFDFLSKQRATVWYTSTLGDAAIKREYSTMFVFCGPGTIDNPNIELEKIVCGDMTIDGTSDLTIKNTKIELHPRGYSNIKTTKSITLDGVDFTSDSTRTYIHFETSGKLDIKNSNFDVRGKVSFRIVGEEFNKKCKQIGKLIEKGKIDNAFKEFGIDLDTCQFNKEQGVSISCPKSPKGNSWPTIWMEPKQAKAMFSHDHVLAEYKDWVFFFETTKKTRW